MEKVIINIDQGDLIGKTGTDYNGRKFFSFLGIPYAKPPIGELRFKAPQPLQKWSGIKNATRDGNGCYTMDSVQGSTGSEDCLFLNIFTPELPAKDVMLKPVMVWIHGWISGSNKSDVYGPNFLLTEDVVVVAVNYRTGILGFLSIDNPELEVPGNAGFKDIVLALKWIQKNIKEFGGDPNNVTLFGANAGGAAVHLLVLSPMAKGLFHKAITQSGSALNPGTISKSSYKELAQVLECPDTNDKKILSFLQKLPLGELYQGQAKLNNNYTSSYNRPIGPVMEAKTSYEEAFLSEHPLEIISNGTYNKVPFMMGYTSSDSLYSQSFSHNSNEVEDEDFQKHISNIFQIEYGSENSNSISTKLKNFCMKTEMPSLKKKKKIREFLADMTFFSGIYTSIEKHVISSSELTFLYKFSVDANLNAGKLMSKSTAPDLGHSDEIGYLFRSIYHPDIENDSVENVTIRRIVKLWTNFAKTGDPNPIKGATWRPVFDGEMNYLDIGDKLILRSNPEEEKMKLWTEIFALSSINRNF